MKHFLLATILLYCGIGYSQTNYSRVKIYADQNQLKQLADLGLAVDHGYRKPGQFIISDFSEYDIQLLQVHGFNYEIQIEDVKSFYRNRPAEDVSLLKDASCSGGSGSTGPEVPVNFEVSSTYGGFYKYDEMLAELDAMASLYPDLITAKTAIPFPAGGFTGEEFTAGETWEGRPIYHVKISDNPNTEEAEPEVLYTAIHHAREPLSMSQTIFYMWYLLENYGTDPEVTYLVDNTEMYFVPCINPDGYIHNEVNDPAGSGMHRKNKNPHIGSWNPGVDLNRNYSYGWNTTGVDSNENSDIYPGKQEFSEPETSAMKYLMETHNFISAFNAHTYGNTLLHPIGTTNEEFADHHDYFTDLTGHMCSENGYLPQKSSGLYPASGDSDDYEYKVDIGVGLKDTVFAMTPEVGTAFWPSSSEIIPSSIDMLLPNMVLSHMAHRYLIVNETDPSTITTMSGNFNHNYQRLGLEDGIVTVSIQPLLNIQSVGAPIDYDVNVRVSGTGSISFTLDPGIVGGDLVRYVLEVDNGLWVKRDTIEKTYGTLELQVFEDGSTTNWTGLWNTTTSSFYSPSTSYTDSPSGNYQNNWSRTYQYANTIDLSSASSASLSFYAKWEIESDYDYCQLQVSTDGGSTWIGQCGNYTVEGSSIGGTVQPTGEPLWEGTQNDWVLEEISLNDYLGQTIDIRFILESDGGLRMDGFYFDDFSVYYSNETPEVPVANFSTSSSEVCLGEAINFTDLSTGVPNSWDWNFGDGSTNSSMENPSYVYPSAGVYDVTLTVTNAEGTDSYTVTSITVNENPTASIDSPSSLVCLTGSPIDLIISNSGDGSGVISGAGVSGTTFDPASAGVGSHDITYTYTNAFNCQAVDVVTIEVDPCISVAEFEGEQLNVFPNPSKGVFTIDGITVGTEYSIIDMRGRLVYKNNAKASKELIDASGLEKGTYFLQTKINENLVNLRIIITK